MLTFYNFVGYVTIVDLLLPHSKLNCKTRRGETPLTIATTHRHTEIVDHLLLTGEIDLDARVDGKTALDHAQLAGNYKIVSSKFTFINFEDRKDKKYNTPD